MELQNFSSKLIVSFPKELTIIANLFMQWVIPRDVPPVNYEYRPGLLRRARSSRASNLRCAIYCIRNTYFMLSHACLYIFHMDKILGFEFLSKFRVPSWKSKGNNHGAWIKGFSLAPGSMTISFAQPIWPLWQGTWVFSTKTLGWDACCE